MMKMVMMDVIARAEGPAGEEIPVRDHSVLEVAVKVTVKGNIKTNFWYFSFEKTPQLSRSCRV